jgi:hypothetical protein
MRSDVPYEQRVKSTLDSKDEAENQAMLRLRPVMRMSVDAACSVGDAVT